jgi:hypothetical protein
MVRFEFFPFRHYFIDCIFSGAFLRRLCSIFPPFLFIELVEFEVRRPDGELPALVDGQELVVVASFCLAFIFLIVYALRSAHWRWNSRSAIGGTLVAFLSLLIRFLSVNPGDAAKANWPSGTLPALAFYSRFQTTFGWFRFVIFITEFNTIYNHSMNSWTGWSRMFRAKCRWTISWGFASI